MHNRSPTLTLLPRVEMAHPARDPAAPAAVLTKVAFAGTAAGPVTLSTPLTMAVSGFGWYPISESQKGQYQKRNEPLMMHVLAICSRIAPKL